MKKLILAEFLKELNSKILLTAPKMIADIKSGAKDFFTASDTYISLTEGELRGHFGFVKGQENSYVDPVIITFIDSINYVFKPFRPYRDGASGGLTIRAIESSYRDVLGLPGSVVNNISKRYPNGQTLPWLEWLLLKGVSVPQTSDGPVDGHIVFGDFNLGKDGRPDPSRSKIALMYQGGSWSVPSEHAGVAKDNWATRTVLNEEFIGMIASVIEKYLV